MSNERPQLSPSTVLVRVPEIDIRLNSNQFVQVSWRQHTVQGNQHTLPILNALASPRTLASINEEFAPTMPNPQSWFDFMDALLHLYQLGVIYEYDDDAASVPQDEMHGYDNPYIHIAMLQDHARTHGWINAIRNVVTADDVVVDIGTGTGVLAIAAAQAGAKHVYAIEGTRMADIARDNIAANGVADRVTVIQGWSTEVILPEKATVMVSEMIGDGPLDERIIEITRDAKRRLLTDDARFVPAGLDILVQPLTIPAGFLNKHTYQAVQLTEWQADYGIQFAGLGEHYHDYVTRIGVYPQLLAASAELAPPQHLWRINFADDLDATIPAQTRADLTMTQDGALSGVVLYSDILLDDDTTLSLHPKRATKANHWRVQLKIISTPVEVSTDDTMTVRASLQKMGSNTIIAFNHTLKRNPNYNE